VIAVDTSIHLVSNDKIQIESARKFGVEAYYLLEEFEKVKEKMTGS
jgi:predicted PilT family ATPase